MRVTNLFLCLLPIAAFANEEPLSLTSTEPFAIAGTTLTLQLIDLVDQRCPVGVDCYWEGMVQAQISVTDGTKAPVIITLCNLCDGAGPEAKVGAYTIHYNYLEPSKEDLAALGRAAELSDYRLTIAVTD